MSSITGKVGKVTEGLYYGSWGDQFEIPLPLPPKRKGEGNKRNRRRLIKA